MSFKITGIALVAVLLLFLGFDVGKGKTVYFPASITAHHYVPERNSISYDSDNQIHVTNYPEEYHLICQGNQTWDIRVDGRTYFQVDNGQPVNVGRRVGHWTGIHWPWGLVTKLEQ